MANCKSTILAKFKEEFVQVLAENNNDETCQAADDLFNKYMNIDCDDLLSEDLEEIIQDVLGENEE